MAAIDKIYVNSFKEYSQFKDWCREQPLMVDKYGKKEPITTYLYKWDEEDWKHYVDAYVIRNCPLDFIQKELMVNYGHWSQERIKDFYNDVINWNGEGECPYWAKKEDFIFHEDGTVELKGLEESDYSKIKRGYLYHFQLTSYDYLAGKHFKCTKHPVRFYNTPFKQKRWFISVETPDGAPWMWYHKDTNTWDFCDEYVISEWTSSAAYVRTIKSLKRLMLKWKLPIGTIVRATGKYILDTYEFEITK